MEVLVAAEGMDLGHVLARPRIDRCVGDVLVPGRLVGGRGSGRAAAERREHPAADVGIGVAEGEDQRCLRANRRELGAPGRVARAHPVRVPRRRKQAGVGERRAVRGRLLRDRPVAEDLVAALVVRAVIPRKADRVHRHPADPEVLRGCGGGCGGRCHHRACDHDDSDCQCPPLSPWRIPAHVSIIDDLADSRERADELTLHVLSRTRRGVRRREHRGGMIVDCAHYSDRSPPARQAALPRGGREAARAAARSSSGSGSRTPTPQEMERARAAFGLPELAVEDAAESHQRPKLEDYEGDQFFVVLKTARYDDDRRGGRLRRDPPLHRHGLPDRRPPRRGQRAGPPRASGSRSTPTCSRWGRRRRSGRSSTRSSTTTSPSSTGIENDIEEVENEVFAQRGESTQRIYFLKREVIEFHRAVVAAARRRSRRIERGAFPQIDDQAAALLPRRRRPRAPRGRAGQCHSASC